MGSERSSTTNPGESSISRHSPDPQIAATWFDALREGVAWQSERRRMYDRDVDVPRLVARYRLDDPDLAADGRGSSGTHFAGHEHAVQ